MEIGILDSIVYTGYFIDEYNKNAKLNVKYRVKYMHSDGECTVSRERVTDNGYYAFDLSDLDILGTTAKSEIDEKIIICVVSKESGFIETETINITGCDTNIINIKIPKELGSINKDK